MKAVSAEANKTRLEAMEAGENVKIQEEIQPGGELPVEIYAEDTILASGGIGGRYQHSTNYPHLTGDALDIAKNTMYVWNIWTMYRFTLRHYIPRNLAADF